MGRREKKKNTKPKPDFEPEDDDSNRNLPFSFNDGDDYDDDEEANEDLSLKIVEKAISRASHPPSSDVEGIIVIDVKKKKKKPKKKKNKTKAETENEIKEVAETKVEDGVDTTNEAEEVNISVTNGVDNANSDNVILRKLLRGPRYFDPPDKSWGACFNCGEEGHSIANCKLPKRKKPCFVCGSFEHEVKQCQKGQDCFICKGGGHRAKDCPKKFKRCSQDSELCLKCGAVGHSLYLCNSDYSPDDLKEIQCYVCKRFGHLCCANYSDAFSREDSCYKCGLSGHNGQACRGSRGENFTGTPSSCFKCGKEGHFARECTNSAKEYRGSLRENSAGTPSSCFKCGNEGHFARECTDSAKAKKRTRDASTPTGKRTKDNKGNRGFQSAPQGLGKGRNMKLRYGDGDRNWSGKSKQRGGWITDDPEDLPRENVWRSPSTPHKKHKIYSLADAGHGSSSSYYRRTNFSYGTSRSQGYANSYQHSYSASRFGYSVGDGFRRNYDRWE